MSDLKKRQWLRYTDETKRRVTMMSVHAGAKSVEEYAGDLFTELVNQMWSTFDAKAEPRAVRSPPKSSRK